MFGSIIALLDDPEVALRILDDVDAPILLDRLRTVSAATDRPMAEIMATAVRHFLERAPDEEWVQLIGTMNRAEDPTLAGLHMILLKTVPETV